MHRIQITIDEEIRDKYDEIITPTMAYITFEEEEAVKIACTNNEIRQTALLGSKMHFNSVRSPSDIIWENIKK